jgi:hypothetical protein
MIYIFDTSFLSRLKHFYPGVFQSVWMKLDKLIAKKELISTREVWNEISRGNPDPRINAWLKQRSYIFLIPTSTELLFIPKIFQVNHFKALIGEREKLKGTPVADPFVIACAKIRCGTVVTEEKLKPNAAKIPNVCKHFNISYMDLEKFMQQQEWIF